jgi:ABC-type spermidine/putrescine transport system permease subunit II
MNPVITWLRNPWGRPRFLPLVAALYILWSVLPVAIAILVAFNVGRSRTIWEGFSMRWFWGDQTLSAFHDPALIGALKHTLLLAVICVALAVPLGVTLPLSVPGILAGTVLIALPMFGDYYTQDLISASPRTSMIGNQIDQFSRQGSEKTVGAVLTMLLALVLLVMMFYYLRTTRRADLERAR